jgi:hypothetical protein
MRKNSTSISKASSYADIGDFWDNHDLTDFMGQTSEASFEVDLKSKTTYYALDSELSSRIARAAQSRGVAAETLLNLWVLEKLQEQP